MNRKEIVEEVATKINSKLTSYNPIKEIIEVSNELADYVINHEIGLLKEFVEFAKGEFIKANYCYNDTYLDTMLEMFLEE